MAAAPLKALVAAEAIGAIVAGGALLVWTGDVASRLALPPSPPSWAVIRLVAVLLLGFGILLRAVRDSVTTERRVLRALAIGHAFASAVLLLQQIAIWNTGTGLLVAAVPLALGVRYAQYLFRVGVVAPSALAAPGA